VSDVYDSRSTFLWRLCDVLPIWNVEIAPGLSLGGAEIDEVAKG